MVGELVSAGIVTVPRTGFETTAGSVGTVKCPTVRELSTTTSTTVATTVFMTSKSIDCVVAD